MSGGGNSDSDADRVDGIDDDARVDDHGSEKSFKAMRLAAAVPGTRAARVQFETGPFGKRMSQSTRLDVSETAFDSAERILPVLMSIACVLTLICACVYSYEKGVRRDVCLCCQCNAIDPMID